MGKPVKVEYTDGTVGYFDYPTEEEIQAERDWVQEQIDKLPPGWHEAVEGKYD